RACKRKRVRRRCTFPNMSRPRQCCLCNLDGVDPIGVERQVFPNLRYGGVRPFVGPDGIDRTLSTGRNAVVGTLALVGAIGLVSRSLQLPHVYILAREI